MKVTEEEYKKSLENLEYLNRCIRLSKDKIETLLTELCKEKTYLDDYRKMLKENQEKKQWYEEYEKLKKKQEKK